MDDVYLPPIDYLRECFSYDPASGSLRWRTRPVHHFATEHRAKTWNTCHAGTEAGTNGTLHRKIHLTYAGRAIRTSAHRVAFALVTGQRQFDTVDHANVDGRDNRGENLRVASQALNNANRPGWAKTGLPKGVKKVGRRFVAQLSAGTGKTRYLGRFDTPEDAHAAYCAAAAQTFGAFFNPSSRTAVV